MRNATFVLLAFVFAAPAVRAQGWAEKMFKDGVTHDFGVVPHGAQLFHRFEITNIYAVRMEVIQLTPGCGCVTAAASKRVLEPKEKATIDVKMDASRFTGPKSVLIKISVGPEFTSSADLKVTANSRADVVFNPGSVNFGSVAPGAVPTKSIDVEYAGVLNWTVTEAAVTKDQPFEVKIAELYRKTGGVGYRLTVTLKPDAPPGMLKEFLYLKTNDPAAKQVPVLVEGTVQSSLTVSPSTLSLGGIKTGEEQTRRVIVKGAKPFRVLEVEGLGDGVTLGAAPGDKPGEVQTVTFKYTPGQAGPFHRELKIKTDLQAQPVVVVLDGAATP